MLAKIKRMTLLFLVLFPLSLTGAYVVFPPRPMGAETAAYEKHYRLSAAFPFLIKYYLLKPQNYNPAQSYPLVLVLHGGDRTTFAGSVLALPAMRQKYPAFFVSFGSVYLVMISSGESPWAVFVELLNRVTPVLFGVAFVIITLVYYLLLGFCYGCFGKIITRAHSKG